MKLFLGVDGGQSSTTALVGDESGRVVGVGPEPRAIMWGRRRVAKFLRAVGGCLREAGFEGAEFEAACLGFSGGAEDKDPYVRELIQAKHYVITHDAFVALIGATAGEPGVVTIAGTGSIAFGAIARAKRRGRAAGDMCSATKAEGSTWSGRLCEPCFGMKRDGARKRCCTMRFCLPSGATGANDLLHRFYTDKYPRERVAAFSKLVDRVALTMEIRWLGDPADGRAEKNFATLATAVRAQLLDVGATCCISYLGKVFFSERDFAATVSYVNGVRRRQSRGGAGLWSGGWGAD